MTSVGYFASRAHVVIYDNTLSTIQRSRKTDIAFFLQRSANSPHRLSSIGFHRSASFQPTPSPGQFTSKITKLCHVGYQHDVHTDRTVIARKITLSIKHCVNRIVNDMFIMTCLSTNTYPGRRVVAVSAYPIPFLKATQKEPIAIALTAPSFASRCF